ncbi:succinylglutamate desuccinylase/aspartoacylase family protein [Alteraurantiacibacter aestuarii]|uniref:succinylglutamate desuccinylase/aspartoacylase family protein n=1 Tax=Alteraurantiacibacter aestuarii TaxID=650004 RepID=UPI0031DFDBC1
MAKAEKTGKTARKGRDFTFADQVIAPGEIRTIDLPISRLSTHQEVALPVRVLNGRRAGPVLFVSAGIHGDEIIGAEIIRRLLKLVSVDDLAGTLICIPVVNFFGFISHQRYLPDRRDLNRCFPGSSRGSLAAQLAHVFTEEIIRRSDYGIDLHSAGLHRTNLPQTRVTLDRPGALELARSFGAPVIVASRIRDGSMRQAAAECDVDVIVYESGEALRFDELAIRLGVKGILRTMAYLGMGRRRNRKRPSSLYSRKTQWIRAPEGGLFRATKAAGDLVAAGDVIGYLSDPFGDIDDAVTSSVSGIIIGRSNLPVVNMGDALMHIAQVERLEEGDDTPLERFAEEAFSDPLFDEDEVI